MSYLVISRLCLLLKLEAIVVRQSRERHSVTFIASAVGKQVNRAQHLQSTPL